MSYIQIGELYLVKQYFWFLYPTKKVAGTVRTSAWRAWAMVDAQSYAKAFSEHYKCNVFVVEPNTYVVLLEMDEAEHCYKLLDSNGNIGWIGCSEFSEYIEVVKANQ